MTIITIPDDLKLAVDKAFPNERIDALVERLLRAEIAARRQRTPEEAESIIAAFSRIADRFPPTTTEELDRLRKEGRP